MYLGRVLPNNYNVVTVATHCCGIYQIRHAAPGGRRYIGHSNDIEKRLRVHRGALQNGRHANRHLQSAWNKYGDSSFVFELLLRCQPEHLTFFEQDAFDLFGAENCYNEGPFLDNPSRGRAFAIEHRRKISEAHMGKMPSVETRRKISVAAARKRIPHSAETKRKISEAHMGSKNHNFGKTPSIETRRKVSEALRGDKNHNFGRPRSDETRRKISEANRGNKHPNFGRTLSIETRRKMSEARRRWLALQGDQ